MGHMLYSLSQLSYIKRFSKMNLSSVWEIGSYQVQLISLPKPYLIVFNMLISKVNYLEYSNMSRDSFSKFNMQLFFPKDNYQYHCSSELVPIANLISVPHFTHNTEVWKGQVTM